MRPVLLFALYLGASASVKEIPEGSCGARTSQECITDMGSCGNACCAAEFSSSLPPPVVYKRIVAYLQSGGVDGLLKFNGGAGDLDIASPAGAWTAIFQGTHTTFKARYNDTLNFAIREDSDGTSMVRIFSISNVAGALGDMGQNRRTVSLLGVEVGLRGMNVLFGCGAAPSLPSLAATGRASKATEFFLSVERSGLASWPGTLSLQLFIVVVTFALGVAVGRYPQKRATQEQLLLG